MQRGVRFIAVTAIGILGAVLGAAEPPPANVADLLKSIRTAGPQGTGSPAARAAWDKLVAHGPDVLPQILVAMDTPDTVSSNWLRTAFDLIAERDLKAGGKQIPLEPLLQFVKDSKRQGRPRRLALELVDKVASGTSTKLIPGWLDDPEFRYEAVAHLMGVADKLGDKAEARASYLRAFQASRDVDQVKSLANKLKAFETHVNMLEHLGFFQEWYVLAPFDGKEMTGFKTVYPPEEKVDLTAEYQGKTGRIKWKRIRTPEQGEPGRPIGLVNIAKDVVTADDAVGYAYTAFAAPAPQEVEFRGAADDNFTVWVNGKKAFGFEEYRNGVRLDRHRFKVRLAKGVNTVLVKVCQAPLDPTSPEPNWEFLLRMVDGTGKGFGFKSALQAK